MDTEDRAKAEEAAERVLGLEAEVEAAGQATLDAAPLQRARALLHNWVDSVIGVVVSPALGRVTLIHPNGRYSVISSPELPFTMSLPAGKQPSA